MIYVEDVCVFIVTKLVIISLIERCLERRITIHYLYIYAYMCVKHPYKRVCLFYLIEHIHTNIYKKKLCPIIYRDMTH